MTLQLQARHRYVTDFAADVAHAFKSPLTSIRGAAELLEDGADDDPAGRTRFLRNILADSERLNQLVTRLLELSRVESSDEMREELSLDDVIRRAIASRESPENCIEYLGDNSLGTILGRARDIETALINLLDNAQRYCPAKVAVCVTVRVDKGSELLGVAVRDRGPGIAPERQSKVFERFFTTEANAGGTGLGLAIVEAVARAHGGKVTLESELGEGATFVLWLSSARE
jgi:two-component system sensor histidine kinase ChvG